MKITHLTSVHPRYDTRIFLKECRSLAKQNEYKVSLIVADGLPDEYKDNISIYGVPNRKNKFLRILFSTKDVYYKALELNSDIYHLHDPELIPIGLKLKKKGKIVIFDIHENISLQILDKEYLPKFSRKLISQIYKSYEVYALKKLDYIILAENSYINYYKNMSNHIKIVLNLPDLDYLEQYYNNSRKKDELFYIGGVNYNRGIDIIVEALKILKNNDLEALVNYVGPVNDNLLNDLNIKDIENNIKFYGSLPLSEGLNYSLDNKVGLCILKPIKNYQMSYSTKIFEYMALGLPVICSNFPLYIEIVEKYNCGICVDPLNPSQLAEKIAFLLNNPEKVREMGDNGRDIVFKKFNWKSEEKKLLDIYLEINK